MNNLIICYADYKNTCKILEGIRKFREGPKVGERHETRVSEYEKKKKKKKKKIDYGKNKCFRRSYES
jgi:hypothetical protein